MLRNYKVVTLTHKEVKLSELSHFMINHDSEEVLKERLVDLRVKMGIRELIYLATCNRVLFVLDLPGSLPPTFLSDFCSHINPQFTPAENPDAYHAIQVMEGPRAIHHLFEVAASINSMVVGEREILRQLREAYEQCRSWGLTGDHLRLAMKTAVASAKEVYDKTRIGEKPVSIVSLAIQQLLQSNLAKDARILLIGAGQTNTLVSKFLLKHGFQNIAVFNRSLEKAEKLATMLHGQAYPLSQLGAHRAGFDAIITCTGHTQSWIDTNLYEQLLSGDQQEKVIIDLAVPNNITEEVRQHFPIHYIEVDDLRKLAKDNLAFREQEVHQAQQLLEQNLSDFHNLVQHRNIERAMHQVPKEIKAVKAHALNQVFRKELEGLDTEARDLVERMMDYMEKRCISIPMQAAKKKSDQD